MDELGYQSENAIISQMVEQLQATGEEYNNLTEYPEETPSFAQTEAPAQVTVVTDMSILMLTMMKSMEQMSTQIANNNNNNNGTENCHDNGNWKQGQRWRYRTNLRLMAPKQQCW